MDVSLPSGRSWGSLNKLTYIWRSIMYSSLKINLFQGIVESELLYGSTAWTITTKLEINNIDNGCTQHILETTP